MKKVLCVIVVLFAFAVAFAVIFDGFEKEPVGKTRESVESQLARLAAEQNKGLPRQIDDVTRWDRVESGPGKTITYHYTISAALSDDAKRVLQENTTRSTLANPEAKVYLEAGVTIRFKNHDTNGTVIQEFAITPRARFGG